MSLRNLTKENKQELLCEVSINLTYQDCEDVQKRFAALTKYLLDRKLEVDIKSTYGYGPCLELSCIGKLSLADAEYILSKDDEYVLPMEIHYNKGKFILTSSTW